MSKINPSRVFEKVKYLTSAANLKQSPDDSGLEVAFAGRSNAGKSSAINALTRNRKLARTSKTPGRTQLLNFFLLGQELQPGKELQPGRELQPNQELQPSQERQPDQELQPGKELQPGRELRLVDLPGYGYAKVPDAVKKQWQRQIDQYLRQRHSLAGLILVMDSRHPMSDFDCMMLDWAGVCNMPVHILLSKADKLKKMAQTKQLAAVKRKLGDYSADVSLQLFSALKRTGIDELALVMRKWLQIDQQDNEGQENNEAR